MPLTPTPIKLTWKSDTPVWVTQWPLPTEKREAAFQLIQEQLRLGHIQPSTSPWNTPIFVIKKKSGKWRLLHDLRAVNAQVQPLGAVQRGLPALTALPRGWPLYVIDLKDCFFSIPLHEADTPRFAFTLPTINQEGPDLRFEWKVLPQGMTNSPTICQLYVSSVIQPVLQEFPTIRCFHYMDDILLSGKDEVKLRSALSSLVDTLRQANLHMAPNKIQQSALTSYLGANISPTQIFPQRLTIRRDTIKTLNDAQQLLGDINWIRPYLSLPNHELQPLFEILKGDSDLTSPRVLNPAAEAALQKVEQALTKAALQRIDPEKPFVACLLKTAKQPTAALWQDGPLLWVHPRVSPAKVI